MDSNRRYKWVMRCQYFLYFGVMGIFLPYFNLWCHHLGFSGFQIGLLSAIRSLLLITFPVLWGLAADRYGIRRPVFVLCNTAAAVTWSFFLLSTDFSVILVVTLLYGTFYAPIIAFMETYTMEVLGEQRHRYGEIRVWGTIAFIGMVLVMGRIIDLCSIDVIIGAILAGSLLQAAVAVRVPRSGLEQHGRSEAGYRFLLRRPAVVFLSCAFLMLVSHGTYYGFFSIHLEAIGYDSTFIGFSWALASVAEIFVMLGSDRIFKRAGLSTILLISFFGAALRWVLLSVATAWWLILLSQCLHALSYAAFHVSSILYIDRLSPPGAKTLGQSVNNALTYGLGMTVGFFLNGWLYDRLGGFPLFLASGAIALIGGLVLAFSGLTRAEK